MRLVLLGPPGVGKGTQAARVCDRWNLPHISTGDLLREEIAAGTELGRQAKAHVERGDLVPDELVSRLVCARIARADGFLLDGFPRNLAQALALDRALQGGSLDRVLSLEASEEVILERLSGRRWCPGCAAAYHVTFAAPRREGICDRCGTGLLQRQDDRPEAIRERLRVFRTQTSELLQFYDARRLLSRIDAAGSPDEVFARIRACLEPFTCRRS